MIFEIADDFIDDITIGPEIGVVVRNGRENELDLVLCDAVTRMTLRYVLKRCTTREKGSKRNKREVERK